MRQFANSLLLTIPQSVGYEQNPLSLYYCYDDDQILKKCIAEVWFFTFSAGSMIIYGDPIA